MGIDIANNADIQINPMQQLPNDRNGGRVSEEEGEGQLRQRGWTL
jgi:hypothetical protein